MGNSYLIPYDVSLLYKALLAIAIPLLVLAVYMGFVLAFLRKIRSYTVRMLLRIVFVVVGAAIALYLMLFCFRLIFWL